MFVATDVGKHGAWRVEQFPCHFSARGAKNCLPTPKTCFLRQKACVLRKETSLLWVVYWLFAVCLRPLFSEVDIGGNSKALFLGYTARFD